MNKHALALFGPLAFLSFVLSFVVIAYLTPGYSHLVNTISELGMPSAPYSSAMNWIGFGLTGLLAFVFALGLRAALPPSRGATAVTVLVTIAGLTWSALGGFPAADGFAASTATTLHFVAVGINYLAFVAAAVVFAAAFRRDPRRRLWVPFSIIMAVLGIGTFLIPPAVLPGAVSQRIALLAYFVWLLGLGWAAWRQGATAR